MVANTTTAKADALRKAHNTRTGNISTVHLRMASSYCVRVVSHNSLVRTGTAVDYCNNVRSTAVVANGKHFFKGWL